MSRAAKSQSENGTDFFISVAVSVITINYATQFLPMHMRSYIFLHNQEALEYRCYKKKENIFKQIFFATLTFMEKVNKKNITSSDLLCESCIRYFYVSE